MLCLSKKLLFFRPLRRKSRQNPTPEQHRNKSSIHSDTPNASKTLMTKSKKQEKKPKKSLVIPLKGKQQGLKLEPKPLICLLNSFKVKFTFYRCNRLLIISYPLHVVSQHQLTVKAYEI